MDDTNEPKNRDNAGRLVAGHAGIGGGRKRMREDVREMLECATPKAAQRLIEALDAERTFVVGSGDDAHEITVVDYEARMKAANHIMDRIYGKAPQAITTDEGRAVLAGVIMLPSPE